VTTAATLAVAGGIAFTTGGAASAATVEGGSHSPTTADRHPDSNSHRWDGHRWWDRYNSHGDWYSQDHGRYRFDGHRFYQWSHGKWKSVTNAYARRLGFDNRGFSGDQHHGNSGHSANGR
jgi:hypothetical protein